MAAAVHERELRYLYVNEALERINGLRAAQHIGRRASDVFDIERDDINWRLNETLHTVHPNHVTVSAITPIGQRVSPTTTALIVGDVAGHNVQAAARMAVTLSSLRTAVLAHPDLLGVSDLLTRSLGLIQQEFFATALVVLVDTDRHDAAGCG